MIRYIIVSDNKFWTGEWWRDHKGWSFNPQDAEEFYNMEEIKQSILKLEKGDDWTHKISNGIYEIKTRLTINFSQD